MNETPAHEPAEPDTTPPVTAAIERRRTNLSVDLDRPITDDVVDHLCRLAVWAPNHRRTEPWRFTVVRGEARRTLGELVAASAHGAPVERRAKMRTKYLRAPVVLLVGCAPHPDETVAGENRDAVAAGVQNILLGATERHVASFWASVPEPTDAALIEWCGWEPGCRVVALVYLGVPVRDVPVPPRQPPTITRRD